MSQINDFMERFADIEIGIEVPGLDIPVILAAEPYQPSNVASVNCPFWVNELDPQGGDSDLYASKGMQERTTLVSQMLCVVRRTANIDLKYSVKNTAAWVDAVYAEWARHVRLSAPSQLIVSSTNTNPITITTAVPHRFTTGEAVTIANHEINTAANGAWIVTVPSGDAGLYTYTIPTAGNGIGGQTGTSRKTQPVDMPQIIESVIRKWGMTEYIYGDETFLAIRFLNRVVEAYTVTIEP